MTTGRHFTRPLRLGAPRPESHFPGQHPYMSDVQDIETPDPSADAPALELTAAAPEPEVAEAAATDATAEAGAENGDSGCACRA